MYQYMYMHNIHISKMYLYIYIMYICIYSCMCFVFIECSQDLQPRSHQLEDGPANLQHQTSGMAKVSSAERMLGMVDVNELDL